MNSSHFVDTADRMHDRLLRGCWPGRHDLADHARRLDVEADAEIMQGHHLAAERLSRQAEALRAGAR